MKLAVGHEARCDRPKNGMPVLRQISNAGEGNGFGFAGSTYEVARFIEDQAFTYLQIRDCGILKPRSLYHLRDLTRSVTRITERSVWLSVVWGRRRRDECAVSAEWEADQDLYVDLLGVLGA